MDPTLTKGFVLAASKPFLACPEIYVKLIAGGLVMLPMLLIFKSVNLTGKMTERVELSFNLPLAMISLSIAPLFWKK